LRPDDDDRTKADDGVLGRVGCRAAGPLRPSGDGDAVALGEAKPAAGRPLVVIMLHTQIDRLELASDHIDMQMDAQV
jgi:hypothetical protein